MENKTKTYNHYTLKDVEISQEKRKEIKARENKARKQLKDQGYSLEKRINNIDPYHSGCYRVLNSWTGAVEAGERFDMTLEDVEKFIME